MRIKACIVLVALLLGACSSAPSQGDVAADPVPNEKTPAPEETRRARESGKDGKDAVGPKKEGTAKRARGGPSGPGPQPTSEELAFPETGRYTFSQSGWEEFCQATCSREDLPPRQFVDVFHRSVGEDRAVVETFTRQSDDRESRSTIRYSGARAVITELFSKVTYEGVTFSDSIEPDPPIKSLAFPMRVGDEWSGSWSDETSGDYTVAITGRDNIAGHDVIALESRTIFSGRYDGEALLDAWVDLDTNMILKSRGRFEIKSNFGTYRTRFVATITSGPGYR